MKKLLVSTIIAVFCILFYKGADAAVVFGMNENTGINNVVTVTGDNPEEEIQIKNMVSVMQGQSFNLSQTSNLTESGDVNIENLQNLSGFPEDFNYNPGAVSVDGYNIKANGTGTAVLKISAYGNTDTPAIQDAVYFAVNCIEGSTDNYNIYNAIETINTGILDNGINSFEDARLLYSGYYSALVLVRASSTFGTDAIIQHDGVTNTWNITNAYKFYNAKQLLYNYFDANRLILSEVLFISEYEGIVLRFGHEITENDILAYSFYREEEYKPEAGITLSLSVTNLAGTNASGQQFTINKGFTEVKIPLDSNIKKKDTYKAEVSGMGDYTSQAEFTFTFIFKSINKGAFVKKKTVIYSGIYNSAEKGKAKAKTRYRCVAKSPGWLKIKLPDGSSGYIKNNSVSLSVQDIASIVNIYDAKYSYADLSRDRNKMAKFYKDVMELSVMSKTADNNNVYCIRLGNPDAKKKILIQSTMHAREWLNSQLVMKMAERCCKYYYSGNYNGKAYSKLFNKVCVYIVPMLNPDGVNISQYGLARIKSPSLRRLVKRLGRGSYRRWKANARGVDLNRNFNAGFRKGNSRRTKRGREGYSGPYAFSERETKALVKLINKIQPKAVINYHEAGRVIYYTKYSSLTSLVRQKTGYRLIRESISGANGSLGDYLTKKGIAWCTPETCSGTAPVSHSQFYYEWSRHRDMIQAVAKLYY